MLRRLTKPYHTSCPKTYETNRNGLVSQLNQPIRLREAPLISKIYIADFHLQKFRSKTRASVVRSTAVRVQICIRIRNINTNPNPLFPSFLSHPPQLQRNDMTPPFPQILSRHLPPATRRPRTLCISPTGTILFSTCTKLHSLTPGPVFRCVPTPTAHTSVSGHELIWAGIAEEERRKDTTLGNRDIVSLCWGPDERDALCVTGDGCVYLCRRDEWGGLFGTANAVKVLFGGLLMPDQGLCELGIDVIEEDDGNANTTRARGDVLCVMHACVPGREGGVGCVFVGRECGVDLFRGETRDDVLSALYLGRVCTEWTAVMDIAQVRTKEGLRACVVSAGGFGDVSVFLVHMEKTLCVECMWTFDACLLPGPVSSVKILPGTRLSICIATGNGFIVVTWKCGMDDVCMDEAPVVQRFEQAHDGLVTCADGLIDGSVITGGTDGSIRQWDVKKTEQCVREVRQRGKGRESVMSLARTPNAFGIVALITSCRPGVEVGDIYDSSRKYSAAARRSVISLLMLPRDMGNDRALDLVDVCVAKCMKGGVACLWDMEAFLDAVDVQVSHAVKERYERIVERVRRGEDNVLQAARIGLWLARVALRGLPDEERETLARSRAELRDALLCSYYAECLQQFITKTSDVHSARLSRDEWSSLESMCLFVSIVKPLTKHNTRELVMHTRRRIEDYLQAGVVPMCPVCETPLVVDGAEPSMFRCAAGDTFERCIRSALAVTDVLPDICHSCESRACTAPKNETFWWVEDKQSCCVCLGGLTRSTNEALF